MLLKKYIEAFAIFTLLTTVNTRPNCRTYDEKEVICTPGFRNHILKRGLVSDNNKTTSITLRYCRITELELEAFENDFNLQYIDLSHNKIEKLTLSVLDGNHKVTHLNLSHNRLTTFPLGLFDEKPHLEILDLKGNRITHLGSLDLLHKLSLLDLSDNDLTSEDLNPYIYDNSTKIKSIAFSGNDMSDAPELLLHAFLGLDFLNLDRCLLEEVPSFAARDNLRTLTHLILSNNQISEIDQSNTFVNLENLEILNLGNNMIHELAEDLFHPLKKLKIIDLSNNRLIVLPEALFQKKFVLENVDLSHNFIIMVAINVFSSVPGLKYLNLSNNRFSYLDRNFCLQLKKLGTRLNQFDFNENPWQCACLIDVLKEMKTCDVKYNSNLYNGKQPVCVAGKDFTCKRHIIDNEYFISLYNDEIDRLKTSF